MGSNPGKKVKITKFGNKSKKTPPAGRACEAAAGGPLPSLVHERHCYYNLKREPCIHGGRLVLPVHFGYMATLATSL